MRVPVEGREEDEPPPDEEEELDEEELPPLEGVDGVGVVLETVRVIDEDRVVFPARSRAVAVRV